MWADPPTAVRIRVNSLFLFVLFLFSISFSLLLIALFCSFVSIHLASFHLVFFHFASLWPFILLCFLFTVFHIWYLLFLFEAKLAKQTHLFCFIAIIISLQFRLIFVSTWSFRDQSRTTYEKFYVLTENSSSCFSFFCVFFFPSVFHWAIASQLLSFWKK